MGISLCWFKWTMQMYWDTSINIFHAHGNFHTTNISLLTQSSASCEKPKTLFPICSFTNCTFNDGVQFEWSFLQRLFDYCNVIYVFECIYCDLICILYTNIDVLEMNLNISDWEWPSIDSVWLVHRLVFTQEKLIWINSILTYRKKWNMTFENGLRWYSNVEKKEWEIFESMKWEKQWNSAQ